MATEDWGFTIRHTKVLTLAPLLSSSTSLSLITCKMEMETSISKGGCKDYVR